MTESLADLARRLDLLESEREITRMIYQVGYAIEAGDFERVGELMGDATLGADMIGREAFRGAAQITSQYQRTNIVYPDRGRATKEVYTNILIDIDLHTGVASSTTSYTVPQQPPEMDFELIVAGKYEDQWHRVDGRWTWKDRYVVVQFKGDLDRHMRPGSQPYN